ncbi:CotH kinase family protein [Arcticibacterium luteifluviistationis]|uniref:LTD domain-containing protein n=1 Tax=Arcticibacterium luteifluviistationis TaxID=1784714 RepID=A0A2Z4G6B1_9BACT|nr:CotH kinase family protein [Arcticibacterium luteifluviistationis]AWV96675.1 hypothetical protein DJ013_00075 [Arcticibacterium luteifluviistationis]
MPQSFKINFILFLLTSIPFTSQAQVNIIDEGSIWSYYDQGNVGTTNWNQANFNSDTWSTGNAELGYGDGDENTLVGFGPNASDKYITTYFRKEVTLPYLANLNCKIKIDDGAVVYLNGTEVFRNNMPVGNPSFNTLASTSANENIWHSFTIPVSSISDSTIVFAIEIHQSGISSSDMSFDFETILESQPPPANLYINEVMASNDASVLDNVGEASDWIEIYSSMPNTTNLKGYFFTDDKDDLTQFEIENDILINPSEYKIFWASDETGNGDYHLNFKLSSSGEWVALVAPDGQTIIDSMSFGQQRTDISYGKISYNPVETRYFTPSTPYANNSSSNSYLGFLEPPSFSNEAGFFDNDFDLTLSSSEANVNIIYSLDGSEPNSNNLTPVNYYYKNTYPQYPGDPVGPTIQGSYQSYMYSGAFTIYDRTSEPNDISNISTTLTNHHPTYLPNYQNNKGMVVRAISQKAGYLSSPIVTKSFFKKTNGEKKYDLPYVSLSFTEKEMFEYQNGIAVGGADFDSFRSYDQTTVDLLPLYVGNYYRTGRENEITGSFEYFEDQTPSVSQDIGIRVHGNRSRHWAQKSLRLYARSEYGKSNIEYPIFKNVDYDIFKRIIVRNGGNDFHFTHFRDAVLQKAVSHLKFDTQSFQTAVLYLNGEYWGLVNLRERLDDDYFEIKYGIDKDSIDVLENDHLANYGSEDNYLDLLNFIRSSDLASPNNYNQMLAKIDVENYIDYQSSEIFYGNQDWPFNNILFWRKKVPFINADMGVHDGRWRWSMYDIDNSAGSVWNSNTRSDFDALREASYGDQWYSELFYKLLRSSSFKNDFIVRNADLLNSTFKPSYINGLIDEQRALIEPAMTDHINRWKEPLEAYNSPINTTYWLIHVNKMKDWLDERGYYHKLHIKQKFGITGETDLILDVSNTAHGHIKINTIEIKGSTPGVDENPYPWTGLYFKNIENKLIGIPKLGYKFSHWVVDGQQVLDDTLSINTTASSVNIQCVFEENFYSENLSPIAYQLSDCHYEFLHWDEESPAGTYPSAMKFVYMDEVEPSLTAAISDSTFGDYDESKRTRINGLDEDGVSFINTGKSNPGYPEGKLGGLILALNTENIETVNLSWTGRTIEPNEREYAIRLQYRVGDILDFQDFSVNGSPLEYARQNNAGDSTVFENIELPTELMGKSYVQLLWRYYSLNPNDSGSRPQLAVDDIKIETTKDISGSSLTPINTTYAKISSSVNIPEQVNQTYNATKSISLIPGFNTTGTFSAEIKGCPQD